MAKLRQALLSFTSETPSDEVSKRPDPTNSRKAILSKPSPQLPARLWGRILNLLGPFALKKFRLVCHQWSVLGAERLYSTVYLNPYESSWSGLVSISTSRHAPLVQKIVWNPLELPEECLDGEIWISRYQNLLRGFQHWQILHFHQAFTKTYRNRTSFRRSSKIESMSTAMNKLINCHEIVLSDDYDLDTSCKDSYFTMGIRSDSDLQNKPTTWGLRPQMWNPTEGHKDSLLAVEDIFQALRVCESITCLKVDLWAAHWNEIHEAIKYEYIRSPLWERPSRTVVKYPHVKQVEFGLRFCELFPWIPWAGEPSIASSLGQAFGCTESFPELQELSFTPSFSDPGHRYMEYFGLGDDCLDEYDAAAIGALAPLVQPGVTASQLVTSYARAYGLSGTVLNCLYAELPSIAPPARNLRTLRISNATVDMRLLLYWLASHTQLPSSSISLHLLETTVLHGLDPGLFLKALGQLNIRISYDGGNTFHLPLDSTFAQRIKTPHLECYLINPRKVTDIRRWSKNMLPSLDVGPVLLEPFPQLQGKDKQGRAEFVHRPNEFEQFVIDYAKNEYRTAQTVFYSYRISLDADENSTWGWVRLESHVPGPAESTEHKRTAALVMLKLIPRRPDDDNCYCEPEAEVLAAINAIEEHIQDQRAQREIEDQELLRQYETDLLGLDLIEVRV